MPPLPRRTTILVVEDDAELRDLYRIELMLAGYIVGAVADGVAALAWIELRRPDAIVLDLGLPRLGGRDLQRELAAHAETRNIPIVLVTGHAGQDINPADYSCVMRKPIDVYEIVNAVRNCIPPSRGFLSFG